MKFSRRDVLAGSIGILGVPTLASQALGNEQTASVPKDVIVLVAELTAKAGEEGAVKKAFIDMLAPTRKEQGCICYNLHQSAKDQKVFMFYELWANQEALDAHGKSPHMAVMREATAGKIEKGGATRYEYL